MNWTGLAVFLPLLLAVGCFPLQGSVTLQSRLSIVGGLVLAGLNAALLWLTVVEGELFVIHLGGFGPSLGITWVIDGLSALMLFLTAIVSFTSLLCLSTRSTSRADRRHAFTLHNFLIFGVSGSLVSADLFNIFVFFEVLLLTSFVQMGSGLDRDGVKSMPILGYVVQNTVVSMLFLAAVGFVYGSAGTVNLASLAGLAASESLPSGFWAAMTVIVGVFCFKAAMAPVFFWLPDSYAVAPPYAAALFSGLLTKVGVYALYRVVVLVSPVPGSVQSVLLILAMLTMLLGVLGALGRASPREILSFHIISQVGYMVFGLALFTPAALGAGLFYLTHHMLVKTGLFFVAGSIEAAEASRAQVGQLYASRPLLASSFFLLAMALAGMPPSSGFFAKLFLLQSAVAEEAWVSTAIAIFVGFLTMASMLKIWSGTFWSGSWELESIAGRKSRDPFVSGAVFLGFISLMIGFGALPIHDLAMTVASDLLDSERYIKAVLDVSSLIVGASGEGGCEEL